ncbi:MAG: hypothetical protein KY439_04645 [Actinobacteria bacterium]|nr:hypothetical protein [Actinomycetota bacterium]
MTRPEGHAAPTDEELVRLLLRVLAAVVALVLALGVATAATRLTEDEARQAAPAASEPAGEIGPSPGRLVAPYLQARTRALAGARGRRSAVVSFADYLDEAAARRSLAGTGIKVHSLLVAAPGGVPDEIPATGSVGTFVRLQREEALSEKRALQELLPTVSDPDFAAQYAQDLARVTSLARWLERPGGLVYGGLVTGPAEQLQRLARRPEVRLVDVGATDEVPDPGRRRGLRPEETASVGEPPERPAPR